MPVGAAIGGAALIGGAVSVHGQHQAQKSQEKASNQAIDFAREQETERKREYDQQQAAAAYQWKVMQANLAPYRAARASILQKYGINTNVEEPTMPEGFGMPGGPSPTNGGVVSPRGGGVSPLMLGGAGLAAGLGAYGQYMMQNRQPNPYTNMPGQYTNSQPGMPGGPPGPPAPPSIVNPSSLYNWSDWSNYYGAPGQAYQGE